ncbi:MAG: type II secretion system F family protein [Actinomycetota bacterium]
MPESYAYKVRDKTGNVVTGTMMADSESLALNKLREMGYAPLEVNKEKAGLKMEINLRPGRVKLKDLSVFSRQFATMINSGLPILRALSILADQTDNSQLEKILVQVRTDVEQGSSLTKALEKHPKCFNELYTAMVAAGEMGGVLDLVLLRLADQIESEVELRRRIKSAMTYPVVVVILVMLIMSAMLLFVVPQFESIYAQLGGKLPLPTQLLLNASNALRTFWWMFLLAGIGFWIGLNKYKKTEQGRLVIDKFKLRVPVFGQLFHKTAMARFSGTLAMLLKSGVPILQALDIVIDTVNNKVIAIAVTDVQSAVREGESMAKPLGRHAVFTPMVVQMLAVGEETGAVDTMLEKVAAFYEEEVKATVDALTSLIEPLLIAVIGGAVGAAVIALYMPMFNIINLIQ